MAEPTQKLDRADYELRFESSRRALVAALQYRESCFARLVEQISELNRLMRDLKIECLADDEDWRLSELDKLGDTLQSELSLSLIVFGRSNTGKSTLLNQLLRDRPDIPAGSGIPSLFPTAEHYCTARLTCASHGPAKTVSIQDILTGQPIVDLKPFEDSRDFRKYIDLKAGERENENTAMLVKISVPSELLRHNLQLVDSPGMGENFRMNEAVHNFLNSTDSAIVVYVVNGTDGYTPNPDTENIRFLMEQHGSLQKVFIANRIDPCIKSYYKNLKQTDADDLSECDDSNDEKAVVECLAKSPKGFKYSKYCQEHTSKRMESVKKAFCKNHPGCIDSDNETTLLGVSAKSVKDFKSGNWPLPHPPYLDSFLELEARITVLVYANARQKLTHAMTIMRNQMMLASVHLLAFKLSTAVTSSLTQTPMELMTRALRVINEAYQRISKSLLFVASEDSLLDLGDPNSELNSLKNKFLRDGFKSQANTDVSLVMRREEANLISTLIQGKNKELQAAIRMLCNFKDVLTSHIKAELTSKYQEAFVGSLLSQTASSIIEGLTTSAEEFTNDMVIIKSAFEPSDTEFSELCADHLVNRIRQILPGLVDGPEFAELVATRSPEKQTRLLDYFLAGVDLRKLTGEAIHVYCSQLRQKKTDIEDRLSAQLHELQRKSCDIAARRLRLKPLKRDLTILHFYLIEMDTELRWTAGYENFECEQLKHCHLEVSSLGCPQLGSRSRSALRPRIDGRRAGELLCRGLRLPADCLKRLASSAMRLRNKLPSQVQFGWLCRRDFNCPSSAELPATDEAEAQLLLAVVNNGTGFRSLADLHPSSVSDTDRLIWLHSLLVCYSNFQSAECHYRPLDYRPSNVLIVDGRQDTAKGGDGGKASVAMPDPTYLLASEGQAAASASLAACIVTLFGYAIRATEESSVAAWDEHYQVQLQRAVSNPESFLTYLPSCLGGRQDRSFVSCVSDCVSACLAASESGKIEALTKAVQRLISPGSS